MVVMVQWFSSVVWMSQVFQVSIVSVRAIELCVIDGAFASDNTRLALSSVDFN